MMNNNCKIVQDLLPNYMEKMTCNETNEFIKEHLKHCESCTKIYNDMKYNIEIHPENNGEDVDYMKKWNKEVKCLKLWKKALILIICIIIIILAIIFNRYHILIKLNKLNTEKSNEITNIYYTKEDDNHIVNTWRKDNLLKEVDTSKTTGKSICHWKDLTTGENYFIHEATNTYSVLSNGLPSKNLPLSLFMNGIDDFEIAIRSAINPFISITSIKYENKDCYKIKETRTVENCDRNIIYEKDTGFLLVDTLLSKQENQQWQSEKIKYEYKIGIVTDEDVSKPDLTQYTLQQQEPRNCKFISINLANFGSNISKFFNN